MFYEFTHWFLLIWWSWTLKLSSLWTGWEHQNLFFHHFFMQDPLAWSHLSFNDTSFVEHQSNQRECFCEWIKHFPSSRLLFYFRAAAESAGHVFADKSQQMHRSEASTLSVECAVMQMYLKTMTDSRGQQLAEQRIERQAAGKHICGVFHTFGSRKYCCSDFVWPYFDLT